MKINGKKCLSTLLIAVSITAVIWIAFSNRELGNAWEALGSLDPIWTLGILGCWFVYMFSDAFGYWFYFRSEGFRISIGRSINASLIGFYYSDITPTSAGGQPMLINSLRKAGIPVGYGTMGSTIRFICNQFAISAISLSLWIANRDFVQQQLGNAVWIIRLGWLINFAGVPLAMMAAFQRKGIQKIAMGLISIGIKVKLIKNREAARTSVTNILDTYHTALKELINRPWRIVVEILSAAVGMTGLIGSIYFVYHAFGFDGTGGIQLLTVSALLYISACYTPLPGASGAQEGGFLLYYAGIIPGEKIGLALLVWRFFTFYMFLLVGVLMVILERILLTREQRKRKNDFV